MMQYASRFLRGAAYFSMAIGFGQSPLKKVQKEFHFRNIFYNFPEIVYNKEMTGILRGRIEDWWKKT